MKNKIATLENLKILRKKNLNKKIVLAHGTFDFFHYGHLEHLEKSKDTYHISSIQKDAKELTLQFSNFRSLTEAMRLLEHHDNTNYAQDLKLTPSKHELSSTAVEHQNHEFFIQSLQEFAEEHILHNSIINAIPEENWNELYQTLQVIATEPVETRPDRINEVFTHFREEEGAADEEKRDSVDIEISTKHITQMPLVLADFLKLYQGLLHWLEQTSYKARRTSDVIHTKLYDEGFNLRKLSEKKVLKCRLLSSSNAYPSPVRHISPKTMIANQFGVKDATDIFFDNRTFLAGEYEEKLIHEKEIKLADHANNPVLSLDQYRKFIEPSDQYHFFHAWDDICFQFLYNNVHNICLPQFTLAHEQYLKPKFGLPRSSPSLGEAKTYTIEKDGEEAQVSGNNSEVREHFYGKWGQLDVWKERWGFDYADRTTFESVKGNYEGTLLNEFYNHDPMNGPLKSFDI